VSGVVASELPGGGRALPEAALTASARWSDPLDQELTAAETALGGFTDFGTEVDRSLADVQGQLEALSEDLNSGSL
jgi:hypothetical protein